MSRTFWRTVVVCVGLAALVSGVRALAQGAVQTSAPKDPMKLTSEQDRQLLMDELKITMFPPGPGAYLASTYDESKANPYPKLPDPLVMNSGAKVTTLAQWKARRAEILELFDREVYGRRPKNIPQVRWQVFDTIDETFGNVLVVTKQLIGHVDSSVSAISVDIHATLSTPKNAKGPVPVVMVLGGGAIPGAPPTPNPCVQPGTPARGVPAAGAVAAARAGGVAARGPAAGPPPGFGAQGPSAQEQIASRGWGYAAVNTASIQADCGAGLTAGIIGLVNKGQPRKLDDWGVLSAWGWGMSKVLDYLETDKAVDAKKVAVQGHSRNGKAALVAIAYDERFLTGFISSSGEGGAKLHRRKYGELIENLAAINEYHWMAGNFLMYAGRWDTLPVDSHELIALCAPRPVFLSAGKGPDENPDGTIKMLKPGDPGVILSRGPVEQQAANINDAWVDAKGTFRAGVGAGPVYRLLGKKDLGTTEFPQIETALVSGDIGFRQHSAGHTPGPNWPVFLDFAAKYFDAPNAPNAGAAQMAVAVLSHWPLDAISHPPDMALVAGVARCVGLGLWSSIPATLIVEGVPWALAVVAYTRATRAKGPVDLAAFWIVVAFLTPAWYGNITTSTVPPGPRQMAVSSAIFFGLVVPWAYWMNRVRAAITPPAV